jgi:hypothetical protein
MNTNENIHTNLPEDVIVLGVASVDTLGVTGIGEEHGFAISPGIEEE